MKKLIIFAVVVLGCATALHAQQDRKARRLADKVAAAFANDVRKLDSARLLRGPLKITIEYSAGDIEFEYKSFRNFAAMERWLKSLVVQPGFPIRTSGDKTPSCRKGLCKLDLVESQMAHNRVYLTKIYYGYSKGSIYIKRLYLLFG